MKNVIFVLFFAFAISSCNTSFSGDTTCSVEIYDGSKELAEKKEVQIRRGLVADFTEGQDVWIYQYYNGNGKASDWRIVKANRYGRDTAVIEELLPNREPVISTYKRAKLVKL